MNIEWTDQLAAVSILALLAAKMPVSLAQKFQIHRKGMQALIEIVQEEIAKTQGGICSKYLC